MGFHEMSRPDLPWTADRLDQAAVLEPAVESDPLQVRSAGGGVVQNDPAPS
jgi:hypothetical protein